MTYRPGAKKVISLKVWDDQEDRYVTMYFATISSETCRRLYALLPVRPGRNAAMRDLFFQWAKKDFLAKYQAVRPLVDMDAVYRLRKMIQFYLTPDVLPRPKVTSKYVQGVIESWIARHVEEEERDRESVKATETEA